MRKETRTEEGEAAFAALVDGAGERCGACKRHVAFGGCEKDNCPLHRSLVEHEEQSMHEADAWTKAAKTVPSIPYDMSAPVSISSDIVALIRDVATTAKRDDHDATVRENDRRLLEFADACDDALDRVPCKACGVPWVNHAEASHPFAQREL